MPMSKVVGSISTLIPENDSPHALPRVCCFMSFKTTKIRFSQRPEEEVLLEEISLQTLPPEARHQSEATHKSSLSFWLSRWVGSTFGRGELLHLDRLTLQLYPVLPAHLHPKPHLLFHCWFSAALLVLLSMPGPLADKAVPLGMEPCWNTLWSAISEIMSSSWRVIPWAYQRSRAES